jgi:uncharacterized protein (DUF885 family)
MTSRVETTTHSDRMRRFFEESFQERVSRAPQKLTALGIRKRQDQLDDLSEAGLEADCDLVRGQLQRLEQFDFAALSPADQLDYRVFKRDAEQTLERFRYRFHGYPINQKFGLHTDFPAFMINMHRIADLEDARNYIARLHALESSCGQVIEELGKRESLGIIPPSFLFPQILGDCRNFIGDSSQGVGLERNVLYQDFRAKLEKLDGTGRDARGRLLDDLKLALQGSVMPAYKRLIAALERQAAHAPAEGGAWSLPDGESYYRMCLERHTSTTLSAEDIHRLGLDDVARIRQEMLALKDRLGYHGNLTDLFSFARDDPEFYYAQTEEGRQACLDDLNRAIVKARAMLPDLFTVLPQDELLVKAVEPHREKTAGLAFYEGPAADGSRPGIFYVNLYDLRQLPTFIIDALAFHEALPGHHMQFSIANRLHDLPAFRRYGDYNAYVEGWGLYSERIAGEAGLYQDTWSDFGRLVQELKRACRLVVDTGIHARRWTRQQAIDYLYENIPSNLGQITKEVDRYIVMPGQATSYTVGMMEILRLRDRARAILGGRFDLRAFHDALLRSGPLPLLLLEEQIEAWAHAYH